MSSLVDVYNNLAEADAEILEKQAAEIKLAEEEDAAGRIMARGFADELEKIAQGQATGNNLPKPPPAPKPAQGSSGTIPAGDYQTSGATGNLNVGAGGPRGTVRKPFAGPTVKNQLPGAVNRTR